MRNDPFDTYRTHEWFESLKWQHRWIEFMVGWWCGTYGKPKTFVDFGAGDGWWSHSFKQAGAGTCVAVELDEIAAQHMTDDILFIQHDLREPWPPGSSTADLVMCFEVAEHLARQDAVNHLLPTLVKSTSSLILFSAAQPGQGGTGHINLQSQSYWIEQFQKHPYIQLSAQTSAARAAFERIVPEAFAFLPRNLLVFARV